MKPPRKYSLKDFSDCIETIMRDPTMRVCTLFCAPLNNVKQRIRITRPKWSVGISNSLIVTYGKPNYEEREFLKLCKKAKTNPKRFWFKYFKDNGR